MTSLHVHRGTLAIAALTALLATSAVGVSAQRWIGTVFPGFFPLPNRVIASIGLTSWSGTRDGAVYQRTAVAVDGTPVRRPEEVYARVAAAPPSHSFTYTLRHGAGTATLILPSQRFSREDFAASFAAYLLNGTVYLVSRKWLSSSPRAATR